MCVCVCDERTQVRKRKESLIALLVRMIDSMPALGQARRVKYMYAICEAVF